MNKVIHKCISLYVFIVSESRDGKHATKPNVAVRIAIVVVEIERASIRSVIVVATTDEPWIAGFAV